MIATAPPTPVTAEEFLRLHGDDSGVELIDGQLARTALTGFEHGDPHDCRCHTCNLR